MRLHYVIYHVNSQVEEHFKSGTILVCMRNNPTEQLTACVSRKIPSLKMIGYMISPDKKLKEISFHQQIRAFMGKGRVAAPHLSS